MYKDSKPTKWYINLRLHLLVKALLWLRGKVLVTDTVWFYFFPFFHPNILFVLKQFLNRLKWYKNNSVRTGNRQNVGFETMKILIFNLILPSSGAKLAENQVFVYGRVRRKGTEVWEDNELQGDKFLNFNFR